MVFDDAAGSPRSFKVLADHMYPIPDGSYVLVGSSGLDLMRDLYFWVVGRLREDRRFEKLSVFRVADDEGEKLRKLGPENKVKIMLC